MPTSESACSPPKRFETPPTLRTVSLLPPRTSRASRTALASLMLPPRAAMGVGDRAGRLVRVLRDRGVVVRRWTERRLGNRLLAVLWRRPEAARPRQHDADHRDRDQQLAQDRGIEPAVRHLLV